MRFRGVLLLVSSILLAGECRNVTPLQQGTLEVIAYDSIGNRLPVGDAELFDGSKEEPRYTTRTGVLQHVDEGHYTLHAHVAGFKSAMSRVYVAPGKTQVRVQMQLGTITGCPTYVTLRGKVSPISGRKDRWLKITPLHGPGGTDTPIQPDGSFHVEGLDGGQYLLIVTEDGKPRHMQVVNLGGFNGPDTVNLKLPPG
ncbi:MAG: hypothetical protein IPJ98_27825 [Bryobacterales bacterium]|nr:hypothetical protein [Bryobacterales bacterium]